MKKYLFLCIFLITTSIHATDNKTKLAEQMCDALISTYKDDCLDKMVTTAIKNGCKKLETMKYTDLRAGKLKGAAYEFGLSNPYDNEGLCYIFTGELFQRLAKDKGLFNNRETTDYILIDLPKRRYSEGTHYVGIVKGFGKYEYETISGASKVVSVGSVVSMKK